METTAIVRGVRLSAQKGRLVADLVRGKPVDKALNILSFTQKKAAGIVGKALESAIANAEHNFGADIVLLLSMLKRPLLCVVSLLELKAAVHVSVSRLATSM